MWIVPCDHGPSSGYDEYGRLWQSQAETLELCWDSETVQKEKSFDTYEEAKAFVNKAKVTSSNMPGDSYVKDFEIKKVTIKPTSKAKKESKLSYDFMVDSDSALLIPEYDTITFGPSSEAQVSITWENGILNVEYPEGTSITEAAKAFFDVMKMYINDSYIIIEKKKWKSLIQRLEEITK